MMAIEEAAYRSFMLRLWQVEQNGEFTWRCSLEETGTGQKHSFASLAALIAFLVAVANQSGDPAAGQGLEIDPDQCLQNKAAQLREERS